MEWMDMSLSKLQEMVKDKEAWVLQSMGSQSVGHDWATEQQQGKSPVEEWAPRDHLPIYF